MGILDQLDAQTPPPVAAAQPPAPAAPAATPPMKSGSILDQLDQQAPPSEAQAPADSSVAGTVGHHMWDAVKSFPGALAHGMGDFAKGALSEGMQQPEVTIQPGADKVQKDVEALTNQKVEQATPDLPKPETETGRLTSGAGRALGNPLTYMGSGGLLLKTMMGIGSGIGGEAGDELGGTAGSIAGSVAGSLLARRAGMIGTKPPTPPTRAGLRAAADDQYDTARKLGVVFDPNSVNSIATDIKDHLYQVRGFRPLKDLGKQTFKTVDELLDPNKFVYTVDDVKSVRTALGNIAKAHVVNNTPERAAAIEAINMLDDRMTNMTPADIIANPNKLPALKELMENAKGNYAASMRSNTLDDMLDRATRRAARTGSGTNIDNVTRQNIDSIINSPKKRMQYTTQELDAMREIVQGTFARNLGRYTGKLSPSGIVSATLGTALGRALAGRAGEFLGPAVGYGAKKLADMATTRAVTQLGEATRARSPLYMSQHGAYSVPIRPSIMPSVYSNILGRQQDEDQP